MNTSPSARIVFLSALLFFIRGFALADDAAVPAKNLESLQRSLLNFEPVSKELLMPNGDAESEPPVPPEALRLAGRIMVAQKGPKAGREAFSADFLRLAKDLRIEDEARIKFALANYMRLSENLENDVRYPYKNQADAARQSEQSKQNVGKTLKVPLWEERPNEPAEDGAGVIISQTRPESERAAYQTPEGYIPITKKYGSLGGRTQPAIPGEIPSEFASKYPEYTRDLVAGTGATSMYGLATRLEKAQQTQIAHAEQELLTRMRERISDSDWCAVSRQACREQRLQVASGRASPDEYRRIESDVRKRLYGEQGSAFHADLEAAKAESVRIVRERTQPVQLAAAGISVFAPPLGTALGAVSLAQSGIDTVAVCVQGKDGECSRGAQRTAGDLVCKRFGGGSKDLCGLAVLGSEVVRAALWGEDSEKGLSKLANKTAETAASRAACGRLTGSAKSLCGASISGARVTAETVTGDAKASDIAGTGAKIVKSAIDLKDQRRQSK